MLKLKDEAARCLLCAEAKCTQACPKAQEPARALRAIYLDNTKNAGKYLDKKLCADCAAPCQEACIHYDRPIRIKEIAEQLTPRSHSTRPSLSLDFCGVKCENPFFLSSSSVSANYEMVSKAFRQGWGGVVFKTIGIDPCNEVSPRYSAVAKEGTPFVGFKNLDQISEYTAQENFAILRRLKQDFPTKVIVASIMGKNDAEWAMLAKEACKAGADIIECNFSCPQMAAEGMGSDVGQNLELVRHYTNIVVKNSTVPVMPKMTPNIQDMTLPALAGVQGGCSAIAAINTIKCLVGVDEDSYTAYPSVAGKCAVSGYSGKAVKPIALKFIYDLASCKELKGVELSGIGGITTWKDALDFILLGCRNVQVTTAVMEYGYRIIDDLIEGMETYLEDHGYTSLEPLVGKALDNIVAADMLDRDTIVYPSFDLKSCIGCGRCVISCQDASHQALLLENGRLRFQAKSCIGCHLCAMVCPVQAIKTCGRRVKKLTM